MSAKSRKKKNGYRKGLVPLVLIVIVIAAISILAGWYWSDRKANQPAEEHAEQTSPPETVKRAPLDGTWVSKYDGTILTVNGLSFSIEHPSVDKSAMIAGTIQINGQTAIFKNISAHANCKGLEGRYKFSVKGKNLQFQLIKDECPEREERMTAGWFEL